MIRDNNWNNKDYITSDTNDIVDNEYTVIGNADNDANGKKASNDSTNNNNNNSNDNYNVYLLVFRYLPHLSV